MNTFGSMELLNTVKSLLSARKKKKLFLRTKSSLFFLPVPIFGYIVSCKCRSTDSVCSFVHQEPPLLPYPLQIRACFFFLFFFFWRLEVLQVPVSTLISSQFNVVASHTSTSGISLLCPLALLTAFSSLM